MGAYEDWLLGVQTSGVNTTPGSTVSTGKVYLGGTKTSYNGNMLQTVDNTANVIDKINEFYTWNEAQRNAFEAKLRKKNYIGPKEKIDPGKMAGIWTTAVNEASKFYSASGGKNKMTIDGILDLYSRSNTTTANLPTQTIQQYSPEQLDKFTQAAYQAKAGQTATAEQLKAARDAYEKEIAKGTVTITKQVGGKNVTTITPGFSQEKALGIAEKQVKTALPDEVTRRKTFEFSDSFSKLMSGGI